MLEAKFDKATVLKHVIDAIKELVTDVNFDCDEDGMKLQAMDNSHVALVALLLRTGGFSQFRCDRNMALGVNIGSFGKIIKGAGNDDMVTLRAQDEADVLNMVFETLSTDRVAEYDMKMMDIDIEHLSIPTTVYDAEVTLSSMEFSRIIRDLKEMGESVRIEVTKEGVKFSADGDIGKASVTLKATEGGKKGIKIGEGSKNALIIDDDDDDDEDEKDDEDEDEEKVVKKKVKKEDNVEDDDDEVKEAEMDEEKSDEDEDEDEGPKTKKRKVTKKKPTTNGKKGKGGKSKKDQKEEEDASAMVVSIVARQSVSLTFSIKYLANFTKATPLANRVTLHMSNEVPLLVEYDFGIGFVRYYLAPKIEDD